MGVVALFLGGTACALGSSAQGSSAAGTPAGTPAESPPAALLPGDDTGFDHPPDGGGGVDGGGSSSSGGSGSSSSSSSTSSSSGASGSTSSSTSSSGASGSTSSSGASGSSASSASSGGPGGACAVCDRDWTCNSITDSWQTEGARCVNARTGTALRCDHKFDQGSSIGVGTWSGNASRITLLYPMLGGGTKAVNCVP